MKVLVVGSYRRDDALRPQFREAARQLGRSLAEAGHELVLGSTNENTADRWVLEGAAEYADKKTRVWMFRPNSRQGVVSASILSEFPSLDLQLKPASGNWTASRVPQILGSDAVILIGGAGGTEAAGHMAPALGIPVLSIGQFGGAAAKLWPLFQPYYDRLGELGDEITHHFYPRTLEPSAQSPKSVWSTEAAKTAVQGVKALAASRMFRPTSRAPLVIMLVVQLALLTAWMWLFDGGLEASTTFTFFGLMAISAFLGTSLRNSLKIVFDSTARLSWDRLLADLNAGLMLGFGLSLMYLLGGIAIAGSTDAILPGTTGTELATTPDFQRVAVVMTVLGMTGGLMIEQAAETLRGWLTDRLAGEE